MIPRRSLVLLLLLLAMAVSLAVTAPGTAQDISPVTAQSTVDQSFAF